MRIQYDRFPGGRTKAITLSYDDGREEDRVLVAKMNDYGLKGAFHLNSGFLGKPGYIGVEEVRTLYTGQEVSAHTTAHPFLDLSPPDRIVMEIMEDRAALEALTNYPVRGMSYPYGSWNEQVVSALPGLGIEYARTTTSSHTFQMPSDFLLWHPTCHHKQMLEYGERLLSDKPRHSRMALLYVWGHSYEFERDRNWSMLEQFGELVGRHTDIWYATNSEIVAYMGAIRQLRYSTSGYIVHNPSAISVWIGVDETAIEIRAGEVKNLKT
ncbi:polysaccharide deacetylase family protein [Paenibacillus sp. UNC451MF]|uniref:polysaccharide deacetylase family protein n=1 Tax=Paenibacillus sp. UNC451MF TaxID=1449063 RepID=UPI00048A4755|nr:polysaccharide deacetylase family protein [Paenibacillus sp. UNC451MF]